jgi:glycosyltransferase involved in cell wall biosynthesis
MVRTVLYVVDSLGLSGKTLGLANLVLGLDPSRYRAIVASLIKPEGALVEQLRSGGVPLVHIPCTDGLNAGVVGRLLRYNTKLNPAVVHCFNPRPMLYGGIAAAATGRPVIGSLSAFACLSPDQHYSFLPQPLHTSSRRNRMRNRLLGRMMRRMSAVSRRAADAFCEANSISPSKMRVIGYGVDLDGIDRVTPEDAARVRAEVGTREGEVLIGSVGRLVEQKDYATQLRALACIGRRSPVRMVIAGGGPLERELRALAQQLGVADRVSWLGERRDIATLLRSLDAFVLASKFEPFGVALLEAMAAGLPIVATKVNEVPEILDGDRGGVLVPPETPAALAEALVSVASNAPLRTRLGHHVRMRARTRYSITAVRAAYQNLYDEVIDERPS